MSSADSIVLFDCTKIRGQKTELLFCQFSVFYAVRSFEDLPSSGLCMMSFESSVNRDWLWFREYNCLFYFSLYFFLFHTVTRDFWMNSMCHIWCVNVLQQLLTCHCLGSEMSDQWHLLQEFKIRSFLYIGYVYNVVGFNCVGFISFMSKLAAVICVRTIAKAQVQWDFFCLLW